MIPYVFASRLQMSFAFAHRQVEMNQKCPFRLHHTSVDVVMRSYEKIYFTVLTPNHSTLRPDWNTRPNVSLRIRIAKAPVWIPRPMHKSAPRT